MDGPSSSTTFGYRFSSHMQGREYLEWIWGWGYPGQTLNSGLFGNFLLLSYLLNTFCGNYTSQQPPPSKTRPLITNTFCLGISFQSIRMCVCLCLHLLLAFIGIYFGHPSPPVSRGVKCCGRCQRRRRGRHCRSHS